MKNTAGKFILKNFVKIVLLIFAVSIAAFALMTVSPVDPLQANVGQAALGSMSQEQIAKLEEYWGVGEPPVQRYLAWLKDFLKGDMGVSLLYRQGCGKGNCSKAGKFAFSYDYCMGSVRDYWLCPGRPGRNEPWKICR